MVLSEIYKILPTSEHRKGVRLQESKVPDRLKIVIFRLLQEALNNVVKHGKAELVSVSLKGAGNRIELLVADNGKGFDADQVQAQRSLGGGFGLHSMNERAELSGGSLFIESNRGAGTIVRVSWPR